MKKIVLAVLGISLIGCSTVTKTVTHDDRMPASASAGENHKYLCHRSDGSKGQLNFDIQDKSVVVTDKSALGNTQIGLNTPLEIGNRQANSLSFTYDWHYTAAFSMKFSTPFSNHKQGDTVNLLLTFDDADGSSGWDEPYTCTVAEIKADKFHIHNISRFGIDWNNQKMLQQGDGLGCPDDPNIVIFTIPGVIDKDFTVDGPGGSCRLVFSQHATEETGKTSTTMIYRGDCAGDNDENFLVRQKGPAGKEAAITVDAGC